MTMASLTYLTLALLFATIDGSDKTGKLNQIVFIIQISISILAKANNSKSKFRKIIFNKQMQTFP